MYYSIIRFTFEYSTTMHILSLNFDGIEESRHASSSPKFTQCVHLLHFTSQVQKIIVCALVAKTYNQNLGMTQSSVRVDMQDQVNSSHIDRTLFSFHCSICYEPLHAVKRPPVILPCGHTFMCEPCSKRLNRCTECRTELFMKVPAVTPVDESIGSQNYENNKARQQEDRYQYGRRNNTRPFNRTRPPAINYAALRNSSLSPNNAREISSPQTPGSQQVKKEVKMEKIPLPIPKNLLLLSLMEIAELEAKARATKAQNLSQKSTSISTKEIKISREDSIQGGNETDILCYSDDEQTTKKTSGLSSDGDTVASVDDLQSSQPANSDSESESDFDDDESRVYTSLCTISSTCGTYVVTDRNGLLVLPRKPKDIETDFTAQRYSSSLSPTASHLPSLHTTPGSVSSPGSIVPTLNISEYSNPPLPYQLEFGAKVQVVSIDENGWVTLARNAGYLFIDVGRQLARVGGPKDKACQMEALLIQLEKKKEEIRLKQLEIQCAEQNITRDLRRLLKKDSSKNCLKNNENAKMIDWYEPPREFDDDVLIMPSISTESRPTTPAPISDNNAPATHPSPFMDENDQNIDNSNLPRIESSNSLVFNRFKDVTPPRTVDSDTNNFESHTAFPTLSTDTGEIRSITSTDLCLPNLSRSPSVDESSYVTAAGCNSAAVACFSPSSQYSPTRQSRNNVSVPTPSPRSSVTNKTNRTTLPALNITPPATPTPDMMSSSSSYYDPREAHQRPRSLSTPRSRILTSSPSSSTKPVDFRTGLSGHCALFSSSHHHHHSNSRSGSTTNRLMSEHRGISGTRAASSAARTISGTSALSRVWNVLSPSYSTDSQN